MGGEVSLAQKPKALNVFITTVQIVGVTSGLVEACRPDHPWWLKSIFLGLAFLNAWAIARGIEKAKLPVLARVVVMHSVPTADVPPSAEKEVLH